MNYSIINKKFKYTFWNVSAYIAVINCFIYFAIDIINIRIQGVPLQYWLSLIPAFVHHGYVWQFFTYMFVHGSVSHLIFNVYAILMFGMTCERYIGSREYLCFYLVTGFLSGVINYLLIFLFGGANVAIMGASGAIYGLLFLMSVLFPYNRVLLFFFIPMKMPLAVLTFFAIELISQFTGAGADVAHLIHLAGLVVAWIYCIVRFRISPIKVWKEVL